MPTLERFVYDQTGKKFSELGKIIMVEYPIQSVIATRQFLTHEKMQGIQRRHGQEFPHIIAFYNQGFAIDGHHKIRRALDDGIECLYSKVLISTSELLAVYLYKRSHGFIKDLQIR
jgi:hypothetical protein